jgi:hypothetical protein
MKGNRRYRCAVITGRMDIILRSEARRLGTSVSEFIRASIFNQVDNTGCHVMVESKDVVFSSKKRHIPIKKGPPLKGARHANRRRR